MPNWDRVPDAPLDPPDEPEMPEPDEPCEECDKENWGVVSQTADGSYSADCMTLVTCGDCLGTGVADGADKTPEEVALIKVEGDPADECKECSGKGETVCGGTWTWSPPEPDEDDKRD